MYQLDWDMENQDNGLNVILDMCVKIFLEEVNL